ncbi:MAG: hypothetical protein ABIV50_07090, partial [Opitutus sp.]
MICKSSPLVAITLLLSSTLSCAAAEPRVEEKIVGPAYEQVTIYTLSPTGMHLGTMSAKGSRFVV